MLIPAVFPVFFWSYSLLARVLSCFTKQRLILSNIASPIVSWPKLKEDDNQRVGSTVAKFTFRKLLPRPANI